MRAATASLLSCLFAVTFATAPATAQDAGAEDEADAADEVEEAPQPREHLTPPALEQFVEATYPDSALRAGLEADVLLELVISDEGLVVDARVVQPVGSGFDESALAAARRFEFAPATRDGTPIASRIRYVYRFRPPAHQAQTEEAQSETVLSGTPAERAPAARSPAEAEPELVYESTTRSTAVVRDPGRRELLREDLDRIAGTRGDALLALQSLPGVGRPPFGVGVFVVRGSAPQDTLVALEGHPYGLPFHFGGFSSTIATDLIDRIAFVPGNFSVRFGRVSGGVVDVRLRAPAGDRPHVAFDLDPIDLGLFGSYPLGRRTVAAVGFRRSFVDLVVPPFLPNDLGVSFTQFPVYYDYQAILEHHVSERSNLRVLLSGYDDQLRIGFDAVGTDDPALRGAFRTHLGHHGAQMQWRWALSSRVTHVLSASFAYDISSGGLGQAIDFDFESWTTSFRDELVIRPSPRLRLYAGIDVLGGLLDNRVVAPPLPAVGAPADPIAASEISRYDDTRPFLNPAGYVEADWTPSRRVRALAGVRVDGYSLIRRATIDPRLALSVQMNPRLRLEGAIGLFSDSPRGAEITPGFGNPDLGPEHALHVSAGFVERLGAGLELDARVFYKDLFDLAARTDERVVRDGMSEPVRMTNGGDGRVLGGEWLLRIRPSRLPLFGWLAYTLSRSQRRDRPPNAYHLYGYDQTHILTLVLGVLLPWGLDAGVRVRYATGLIEPRVTGGVLDADSGASLFLYDRDHPSRLPPTFTLDLRFAKHFRWGPMRMAIVLEVLNATNHANAERRIYSYDRRSYADVHGLPILPSLGLRGEY